VRVGFVSYYFREHSVSKMALGLVAALDKTTFHTVLYQFGNKDHITEKMAGYMSKLVMLQGTDIASAQRLIADEQLDVLVFAEIGMDPHAYALAFGRHAPIQIAMHGHAQTSGVASIDYYVSYKGFSEPEAQSHYSERLLVVDGYTPLTRYYDLVKYQLSPHMYTEQGRNAFKKRFKIPMGSTVYACLQTLFKVDPRMDHVTKRILEGDSKAVVLFKELPMTDQVGKLAIDRMRKTLSEEEMQRVIFMPPVAEQDYRDAYLVVDVLIDSFPFGGHTTSMDAFSAGCPVVTMPTDLMSGRCTQGFLSFMGLGELIVADVDSLVQVSLKVGRDKAYRDKLSRSIIESLPALTRDETSVREWASLLAAAGTAGHKALEKWHSTSGVRKYTGG
jgi:protein O-GlcNAc transferase